MTNETADTIIGALVDALEPFAHEVVDDSLTCHYGLTTKEKCGRCSRILAARAACHRAKAFGTFRVAP